MMYYVFESQSLAIAAEEYICQVANMPLVGVNASTGELSPTSQRTERWAVPEQRLDGKWVFPVVPISIAVNFSQSVIDFFNINFPHQFEEFQNEWFYIEDGNI
jgi:hypothetical protein